MTNAITLSSVWTEAYTVINIQIEGGVCSPSDLKTLEIPLVAGNKGIVLNGRAPVWLFATLAHHFHPTQWVACNDPRLGAVVVQSHTTQIQVGDIIPVSNL